MMPFDEEWAAEVDTPFPASLGDDLHALLRTVASGGPPLETGEEWVSWDEGGTGGDADDGFAIDWDGVATTAQARAAEWEALAALVGPIPPDLLRFLLRYGTPSIPCGLLLSRVATLIDLRRLRPPGEDLTVGWMPHWLDAGLAEPTVIASGDAGVFPAFAWMPGRRAPDGRALWLWLGRDAAGEPDGMVVAPLGFDVDRVVEGVLLGAWDLLLPDAKIRLETAERLTTAPPHLRSAVLRWRDGLVTALADVPDGPLHAGETLAGARDELLRRCALVTDPTALASPDPAYVDRIQPWRFDPPVPPEGPELPRTLDEQDALQTARAERKAKKRALKAEARARAAEKAPQSREDPAVSTDRGAADPSPEVELEDDALGARIAAVIMGFLLPGSIHLTYGEERRAAIWFGVAIVTGCGFGLVNLACAWASYRLVVAHQAAGGEAP